MSWKTVTLDEEAYQLLKRAKKPRESFGDVVRRTFQQEKDPADYLEELAANPPKVDVALLRRRQLAPRRSNRPGRMMPHAV
jgi:predicted CopG family antitoxin